MSVCVFVSRLYELCTPKYSSSVQVVHSSTVYLYVNLYDIVSLAHNHYFWGHKLNHNVSFWVQKLNHNVSFWAQKFIKQEKFLFKWIFLVSIELINNPKPVQIIFFFFYWLEFWKKIFEPETEP